MTIAREGPEFQVKIWGSACFPQNFTVNLQAYEDLSYANEFENQVNIYSLTLTALLLIYLICIDKELKECRRDPNIAKKMNGYSMQWLIGWTFALITVHFMLIA